MVSNVWLGMEGSVMARMSERESFFPILLIFGAKLFISKTSYDMVIDNTNGLKMSIKDGRSHKSKTSTNQILTDLI